MNEQRILSRSPYGSTARFVPDAGGNRASTAGQPVFVGRVATLLSVSTNRMLRATCFALTLLLGLITSSAQAQSLTVDLSVRKVVSNQSPAIGDVLTYTVVVANSASSTTATGVVVTDQLPVGGVTYVPGSASIVRGSGTYVAATGIWSVGTVAPNDSSVLILQGTVLGQGVWFNTAEVTAADQADFDSAPNNQILTEDDYDAVCFSVPIVLYQGDEYTVMIPSGYDQIVWYRNDIPISTSTVSASLAVVNPDLSLIFKSPGIYRFETFRNGCLVTNCCNIEVLEGLFGVLGDRVFVDANKDGLQGTPAAEPGIPGVVVVLLDATLTAVASTTTDASGLYSFTGLTVGIPYSISFVTPAGFVS
ncbi:SdrD B-like domain-containing protein, partial [Spirosoma arcticum]